MYSYLTPSPNFLFPCQQLIHQELPKFYILKETYLDISDEVTSVYFHYATPL